MRAFAHFLSALGLALALTAALPSVGAAEEAPLPRVGARTRAVSRDDYAERIALVASIGGAAFFSGWVGSWVGALTEGEPRVCGVTSIYAGGVSCYGGPNGEAVGLSLIPIAGSFLTIGARDVDGGRAALTGVLQVAGVLTLAVGLPLVIRSRTSPVVTVSMSPGGAGVTLGGAF